MTSALGENFGQFCFDSQHVHRAMYRTYRVSPAIRPMLSAPGNPRRKRFLRREQIQKAGGGCQCDLNLSPLNEAINACALQTPAWATRRRVETVGSGGVCTWSWPRPGQSLISCLIVSAAQGNSPLPICGCSLTHARSIRSVPAGPPKW